MLDDAFGNIVGLNAAGTVAIGNDLDGILLRAMKQTTSVAPQPARDVVAGNHENNLEIEYENYDTVQGNYIGTDITGTIAHRRRG